MKIMFTSPGRRVELIEIFKRVFADAEFYGGDYDPTSPANYFLDKVFELPYKIDEEYVERVFEVCRNEKINFLIPLIDPELIHFAKCREKFFNIGTFLMISRSEVVEACMDKWKTNRLFKKHGISCVNTWIGNSFGQENLKMPIIFKPRIGSASKGIYTCRNSQDFEKYIDLLTDDYIVQEFIEGYEVTVDVFATESGKCIKAIQRRRLKVKGGEVERGVTQKDTYIFSLVKKIVKTLKPLGVINIQFIYDSKNDTSYAIEINPRFGGGYPLTHTAGANFPLLLYNLANGDNLESTIGSYKDRFYMLRYEQAVYTDKLVDLC